MNSFTSFGLNQAYGRLSKVGDPLSQINSLIEWERFRPITVDLYDNKTEKGGHPNFDSVLMIKILVLQQWYGLSDQSMERGIADRLSFMKFLGFPETIPDSTTIWFFRERLIQKGKLDSIWQELQRQLDTKGLVVKVGSIQDATFITSDPGRSGNKPRGDVLLTEVSRSFDVVETKPELVGAKMELGLRKARSIILAISSITRWMLSMV
jgi:transposase, IS5 family